MLYVGFDLSRKRPKRSNVFQDVVAIVHAHMAEGATVEESGLAMLKAMNEPIGEGHHAHSGAHAH